MNGRDLIVPLVESVTALAPTAQWEERIEGKAVIRYAFGDEVHPEDALYAYAFGDVAIIIHARRPQEAVEALRAMPCRIKALALLESTDPVDRAAARAMFEENLADPDLPEFERTLALATLARHERSTGRLASAVRRLREALAVGGADGNGTNGEEEIELAEMLLARDTRTDLVEAKRLLDRRASEPPLFARSRYRLAVAQARACARLGDDAGTRQWASSALDLAALGDSGLPHHPDLGLVDAEEEELEGLREMAHDVDQPIRAAHLADD